MWVSGNFKGQKEFKRRGVCSKLIYDETKGIASSIDKADKCIYVGKDSGGMLLTDKIGLQGAVRCMAIFVENGVLLEIVNVIHELINVTVVEADIESTVQSLFRKLLFQFNDPFVFIFIKIVCFYAQRKSFKSNVCCISTISISVRKFFYISCR